MSKDTETLEVNTEELSDEVLEELKEKSNFDDKVAEKHAEKIKLEEMDTIDPEKISLTGIIGKYINRLTSWASQGLDNLRSRKTPKFRISNVKPKHNGVSLTLSHPNRSDKKFSLSNDSSELANLLEYHNADSPAELKDQHITVSKISDASPYSNMHRSYSPKFCIPHNVSAFGKLHYKIFTFVQQWREKTIYWTEDPDDHVYFALMGSLLLGTIGFLLSDTLLFNAASGTIGTGFGLLGLGLIFITISVVAYIINQLVFFVISYILQKNFYKQKGN